MELHEYHPQTRYYKIWMNLMMAIEMQEQIENYKKECKKQGEQDEWEQITLNIMKRSKEPDLDL